MTEPSPAADSQANGAASDPINGAGTDNEGASAGSEGFWPPSGRTSPALTQEAAAEAPPETGGATSTTSATATEPAPSTPTALPTTDETTDTTAAEAIPVGPEPVPEATTDGGVDNRMEPASFDATTAVPVGPGRPDAAPARTPAAEAAAPVVEPPTDHIAGDSASGRPPTISIEGVTRHFRDVVAVNDLSLIVEPGTILGLIGPSGAGKTTTIRLLTGALKPDRGTVRVLGEDPRKFRRRTRERIGYMPQQFLLYPDLTADENVDFVASLFGMLLWRRRQRVRKVLDIVGLLDARDRRASRLSGGMQRRLALACALVHDPALLFLDEPTAGIDPLLRKSIWTELHRLRDAGRTLVVTTQYVNEAEECDEVALIAHGRLVALAPPEELRREALGGEVIDVETTHTWDNGDLRGIPLVRAARQIGPRRLLVVTEDAGAATPAVVEAVRAKGGDIASVREYTPSFDEVFAELVGRGEGENADDESGTAVVAGSRRDGA